MISKGGICIALASRPDSSGVTTIAPLSTRAHVSTTSKVWPTRTALALVRHRRALERERAVNQHEEDVVHRVQRGELREHVPWIVEQKVGDHREERRLPDESADVLAQAPGSFQVLQVVAVLIGLEAMDHLTLADGRPHAGHVEL